MNTNRFPIYSFTRQEKREELIRFLKSDFRRGIRNGVVQQNNMLGLGLCWSYFPHSWHVRCGDRLTPMQVFSCHRDAAIGRRRAMGERCRTESQFRKALRTYCGAQGVSGFRPAAALALYNRYLPLQGGIVYDPSCGWGGRLLGALCCRRVTRYVGTDPSSLTFQGLCAMRDELPYLMQMMGYPTPKVQLYNQGSEDLTLEPESVDLVLWSPPYSGHERYSDEKTQSAIRFPDNKSWMNGFMRQTLEHCRNALKPGCWLVVNIADTDTYPSLTADFLALAKEMGFKLTETLQLALSKMIGLDKTESHKHEPVYALTKAGLQ